MLRFARDDAGTLKPLQDRGPFLALRELSRRVGPDCAVEMDTNTYSVPWRLIGERVRVLVAADTVRITHGGIDVACHRRSAGRRGRIVDPVHFAGIAGAAGRTIRRITDKAGTDMARTGMWTRRSRSRRCCDPAGGAW